MVGRDSTTNVIPAQAGIQGTPQRGCGWSSRVGQNTVDGVIKLSLGRKRHVLLKPR